MQVSQGVKEKLSSLSALTRAATASARAAEIEKETGAVTRAIPIAQIRVKPQVRHDFSDVADFAERLKQVGHVHTPILVREIRGENAYELIAGERRVRASKLNEWQEIQAKVFPAITPDIKIRMYQVSENVDRKSLSLRETAIGLAADVEQYGREEAARIWTASNGKQRSASWISKHLRFLKYGPVTRELFDASLFDDIEAANKLDDIEAISADVAAELAAEIREGRKIGRVALDARLDILKQGERSQTDLLARERPAAASLCADSAFQQRAAEAGESVTSLAGASANVTPLNTAPIESSAVSPVTVAALCTVEHATAAEPEAAAPSCAPAATTVAAAVTGQAAATPPRVKQHHAASADPKSAVVWRIEQNYQAGTNAIERLRALRQDLRAAGVGSEVTEWRTWVAFVDIVAPALVGVGSETWSKIINRLVAELNSSGPLELLNRLHPTSKAGVLPDDFGYDTDREIHPLAPGDWAL
jgi:ParB family transcriptional regulator, chromosome partitioning protein